MTAKRMPKRGPHGEFLSRNAPSDAQRDEKERKQQVRPVPSPRGVTGSACLECGTEQEELMVAVRGGRVKIIYCPRCVPEPLESIRGE